ncbi:MAG: PQQ-binding-like beta-propeller repeat protein [Planctomycetota bacterium]|nr:PQQ-binding-like beta-propeller repeat protein [Planctomycetota bacterium]
MHASMRRLLLGASLFCLATGVSSRVRAADYDPIAEATKANASLKNKPGDSPQLGLSQYRNNVTASSLPVEWDVKSGKNVKFAARLGSQTYASPVVANGKVFVGTNNSAGFVKRFPSKVDLGCMVCYDAETGKFLWQHSNEKLPAGRVLDWEQLGVCSSPVVSGDRLWYISNRDELCCLDIEGFLDGENDGPFKEEQNQNKDEADIVWKLDLIKLGASPHNASSCSITLVGDVLLATSSNGVDEGHKKVAQANAPVFLAIDKNTGKVIWSDASSGGNIMHGTWSSPCFGELGGIPQAIFAGGDGWLYAFDIRGENGKAKPIWKFDCNPKASVYKLERATRNPIIGTPVIYDGLVYIGVGEDPEHGEGNGHLWCVDPTKQGDISPTQVFSAKDPTKPIPHRRVQALDKDKGEFERDNPNSGLVWHYEGTDTKKFDSTMHRTLASAAIKDNLLFIADQSGLFHCLDAKTGKPHWTHDMLAASWSTALIAGDKVYIADVDGQVAIFKLSAQKELIGELELDTPVNTTLVCANGILYAATFNTLYAIQEGASFKPGTDAAAGGGQ